jgi:hypothetical protein
MLYQGKHRADSNVRPGAEVSQEPVRHRWLLGRPTFGGLAVALVYWWARTLVTAGTSGCPQ